MTKYFICLFLFFIGFIDFSIILGGSHGNMQFRPWMLEDWIFDGVLVLCWGIPVIILSTALYKKLRNSKQPIKKK